jgi:hypothetical protein
MEGKKCRESSRRDVCCKSNLGRGFDMMTGVRGEGGGRRDERMKGDERA